MEAKTQNLPNPASAGTPAIAVARITRAAPRGREYGVIVVTALLFIILSVSSSGFLTKTNLLNILNQWSAVGIIAFAATLVLIAGGFDLSVAAVFSFSGVIAAKLAGPLGVAPALLIGTLSALAIGLLNGLAVVMWRVNSIIATLASGFIIGGLTVQISSGSLITVNDPSFASLGSSSFLGVTLPVWFLVLAGVMFAFLLHRTTFGRYVFATGDNAAAAVLSGIRVNWVRIATFGLSGLAAGFAGVMVASQQTTGQANAAPGMEFDVLAAVIVGGTSILGGAGAIWRTAIGVLMLAFIQNGSNLLNVSANYEAMIYGGIILGAAALDVWARRRSASS
jgi:ribose transport system permease protein